MEPLPGDAKRWTKQYVSPAKDFVTRQEVKDEEAERLTIGSSHPQASAYPDFTLVGFEPAQRGSQYAYYCKTRDAQWAYNYEHASTAGDELPTVSYTWIIPRADFKNTGEVQAIPANQMPTFGGAYVWTLVGARMVRFNDYLDGLFVQVIHDYWDKEHPIRTEELDTETGELREVTRALVPYGTDGTALNASGSISTYQHINERVGWMVTRKATGLLGGMVKGRKVRIKRGVKPHYWPKVLDYISVYPVHTDPRDVFSPISGYNTARKFLCEDYNGECKVTIVERITLKEPIFGGDPDWDTDSPSGDSPDIPVPTPLLEAGIRFDGTELVVNCESCLRQEYSFRDSGWMETFPASSPVRWPESRLVSVDVRPENGAWVTEYVMVDAPNGRGLSSGLDLIQRSAALSTSVEVKWTPQLASGSTQEVRIDVSTTGDFSGGFLTGFRDKLVTPANNTPADQWVNITGMERGSTYFVRVRRRNAGQDIATSNTLVVTSKPSPELSLTRDKVPVPASSTLQFGDVEVGKTARITILLNSIGLLQVQEIAARLSGDGEAVFGHDVPTVSLPPTVTAPLELRFSPTAVGVITATFTVTSDAIDSPLEITLRGIGAAAEIALEQPSGTDQPSGGTLSFGTVTTGSVSKVFKLTNTGNAPLRNITAAISGTNTADFTFTTLLKSTEIAAGGFAEFTIKFDPIESELAFGARAAVLTIGSNDGDENPLTLNLTGVSQSPTAPGALEASFNPSANGVVRAMITQADGKILVGGDFTTIGGTTRNRIGRVNTDGTLDSGFNPDANGVVRCVIVQPDGKILIAGDFTTIGGTTRNRLALLNADGTLNSWYPTGGCNASVYCMARKDNGAIWIGGTFSTVGGSTRKRIALINADASINAADPAVALGISIPATADVRSIVLDTTERLIIGGYYLATVDWGFVARLLANGDVDSSFIGQVYFNGPVNAVALLADGTVVAGGNFTVMNSVIGTFPSITPGAPVYNRVNMIVLTSTGAPTADVLDANGEVHVLALQSDGKVHVGGAFTTLAGSARLRLARLLADLRLEAAWDPQAGGTVRAMTQQDDGLALIGGDFTTVAGTSRPYLARLQNNAANSTLAVADASLVTWQRSGALAESLRVLWQVDTGSGYGALAGVTTRTSGGWQLVPTTGLSGTGTVKALALPNDGHSSGLQQATRAFNFAPEIVVEVNSVDTANGATVNFGDVQVGVTKEQLIVIRNTGLANLTISSTTLAGTAAARYTKINPLTPVPAGGAVTCTLRFLPTATGSQPATITFANNDSDEGTFLLNLVGTGTPGPGGLDTSWQPTVTGAISTLALRPGEVIVGGDVTFTNAQARKRWAELDATTGLNLPQSGTASDRTVYIMLPLLDGRTLLVSTNTSNATKVWVVSSAGVTDTSFTLTITGGRVNGGCLMPDGGVVLVGTFTMVNSRSRSGSLRLVPGTLALDLTWDPNLGYGGATAVSDSRGGLWVGLVLGNTSSLLKLNANGSIDSTVTIPSTFNTDRVYPSDVTPAGGVVVYGITAAFAAVIYRLLPTGAIDSTFTSGVTDNTVPQVQTDGRILVYAVQSAVSSLRKLWRLLPTGAVDPSFNPYTTGYGVFALDSAGRIYAAQPTLQRQLNDAGVESLTVTSAARVEWLRSGSLPEVQWVRVEVSEDSGSTWRYLGLASRISGGWELTGLALPRNGRIRVQASTGRGVVEALRTYTELAVADLDVERANTVLAINSNVTFAGRQVGQTSEVTLTLRNTGNATLTGLALTVTGEFSVVSLGLPGQADPTTLTAGQSTQAVLRFTPTISGVRAGTLAVASSVTGVKSPYRLTLSGNGSINPAAITDPATLITRTGARLNAKFTPNDDTAACTIYYRQQSLTALTEVPISNETGFVALSKFADVTGLTPLTYYEFYAVCTNSVGQRSGIVRTFRTLGPP